MHADILPICAASGSMRPACAGTRAKPSFVARLGHYALALLALLLIAYGARWSVLEAPAAASEFVAAARVVDVVAQEAGDVHERTNAGPVPAARTQR